MKTYNFPTVTLSNGLTVANFSSPHEFKFEDGSILDACTTEHSTKLSLKEKNIETPSRCGRYSKVEKKMVEIPGYIWKDINQLDNHIDIILVSYPTLIWAKETLEKGHLLPHENIMLGRMATCNMDRQTKLCSIDKFCF